ncbi:hypothetical protein B0T14DRAFT_170838 [Immersiella caudata]|uniref:Uncharacterized protein n=1 Tax=Immersiella caudata TaxID=314043 RepID=A0AA39WX68_9PEZI|nr:hypothetical protein B0T14DRAFT_170838 [Immersiella caudata]
MVFKKQYSKRPSEDGAADSAENMTTDEEISSFSSPPTNASSDGFSSPDDMIFDEYLPIHLWGWVLPPDPADAKKPDELANLKSKYGTLEETLLNDQDLHYCDRYPLGTPSMFPIHLPPPKILGRWIKYEAIFGVTPKRKPTRLEWDIARSQIRRERRRIENGVPTIITVSRDMLKEAEAEEKNKWLTQKLSFRKDIRLVNNRPGVVTWPCLRCAKKGLRCSLSVTLNVDLMFATSCNSCIHAGEEFCVLRAEKKADMCNWELYEKKGEVPAVSPVHMKPSGVKEYWAFVRVPGVDEAHLREFVMDMLGGKGCPSLGSIGIYSLDSISNWALPAWEPQFEFDNSDPDLKDETASETAPGPDSSMGPGKLRIKPKISPPPAPISATMSYSEEDRMKAIKGGWLHLDEMMLLKARELRETSSKWA